MTREQSFFLRLMRDSVCGTATTAPAELDWDEVYGIAERQCLVGFCYAQLRGADVPKEALDRFHRGFFSDVYHAANFQAVMGRVREAAAESGPDMLPFKGWIVKDSWPVPELRTMGDIDLLIRTEDRAAADALMTGLGLRRTVHSDAVWSYTEKDAHFEVHDHIFYDHLGNEVDYRTFFDRAWEFAAPELSESFHMLLLLAHLARHITNQGVGFRFFLDLVFFCREKGEAIDWPWVERELEGLRLRRFADVCFALCRAWFGADMPLDPPEPDGAFYESVTEKMFRDGIFGLENEQNSVAGTAREMKRSTASYGATALRLTAEKLFPAYESMRHIPWYGFVDGRPWLLPAAWVYRWWYCLAHKGEESARRLAEPYAEREKVEKREQQIRDWGL